jgi:hypothetical protein
MTGDVTSMGKMQNAYKVLGGKAEEKRPLVKPWHRWEDISINIEEVWGNSVARICRHQSATSGSFV